jgi:hypothetical protein
VLLKLGKERMTMNHNARTRTSCSSKSVGERLNHAPDFMKGVVVRAVQTAAPEVRPRKEYPEITKAAGALADL